MAKWIMDFINNHGERIVFMFLATLFGVGFYMLTDMQGEAKTILIGVATLCLNKARSTVKDPEK